MSNDNTLDDLILTEPEPEKVKSKGLLALLALVILLIIVGAILAKMIFSDPDEPTKMKDEQKVEVTSDISANNKDKVSIKSKLDSKNADLAPITSDPDLAPLSDNTLLTNVDTINIDEEKDSKDKSSRATKSDANIKGDSTKVANEEDDLGVAPVGKTSSVKKEEIAPKKVVVKERVREHKPKERTRERVREHKPKERPKRNLVGGRGNVYIQVGSFTKGPESSFIRKIRRAGFKYRIKSQNGYRRVYVGPFESRKEAARYLGRVRSEINPEAFIK